jgi:hypothetical protein
MSGIGQYLTICPGQIVEFLGRELQSSGPCHIVLLIKIGPNNYLRVTNVDRNNLQKKNLKKLLYFQRYLTSKLVSQNDFIP